ATLSTALMVSTGPTTARCTPPPLIPAYAPPASVAPSEAAKTTGLDFFINALQESVACLCFFFFFLDEPRETFVFFSGLWLAVGFLLQIRRSRVRLCEMTCGLVLKEIDAHAIPLTCVVAL